MKLWKRNAIAAAIVLFVCGAVYLNWSYSQDTAAGKNLGEAALVGSQNDPLLEKQKEGAAAEEGAAGEEGAKTEEGAAAQEGADAEFWYLLLHSPPQPAAGPGQRPLPAPGGRRG